MNNCDVLILFEKPTSGSIELVNAGIATPSTFANTQRLELHCSDVQLNIGSFATVVTVHKTDGTHGFSFFLRDVTSAFPLWMPDFQAAVVPAGDARSYDDVAKEIRAHGWLDDAQRLEQMPEESLESAMADMPAPPPVPTWLGLGREPRIFKVSPRVLSPEQVENYCSWGSIIPIDHQWPLYVDEKTKKKYELIFSIGPGAHGQPKLTRRLLEGWMPILTSVQDEQTIRYEVTAFATCEQGPITLERIQYPTLQEAYDMSCGPIKTLEQYDEDVRNWRSRKVPDAVCVIHVVAINTSNVPAYAYLKSPEVNFPYKKNDFADGLCSSEIFPGLYTAACQINGEVMSAPEYSVLLQPGQRVEMDLWIPHQPLCKERMQALLKQKFSEHLDAAIKHWKEIVKDTAQFSIPETGIAERVKAGLPHLETVMTGPGGDEEPLLANCGVYSPIGTESSPIIQYLDSIGLHNKARRCIDYFLEYHQKENGFIQCFVDYQSETGPVLWTAGQHYLYTKDIDWLRKMTPHLKLSCDFLLDWRNKNKTDEDRKKGGWGLASGKVADPDDFYHSFFLNAGNYLGLSQMANVLQETDPEYAAMLAKEVVEYRQDIEAAVQFAIEHSPVIPLEDGSWTPAVPSWAEHHGFTTLYADGGKWYTHGDFAGRDCLTGPIWIAFANAVAPDSFETNLLLKSMQHPQSRNNAALSQPYYSRHDYMRLIRGEVKLFLKTFYRQLAGIQDRETYSFWEHYYLVTSHKTHEEGWFLMQVRWMFYVESAPDTLRLFGGTPRAWFTTGATPGVKNAASTLGHLSFLANCSDKAISCFWQLESAISHLEIRLPHPSEKKAIKCSLGKYYPEKEMVVIDNPPQNGQLTLEF